MNTTKQKQGRDFMLTNNGNYKPSGRSVPMLPACPQHTEICKNLASNAHLAIHME